MSSQDLRVVKTRRAIHSAFTELLSEKSINDITVSELAARAMVNRKTFYRHYASTGDVATELEDEILANFCDVLNQSTDKSRGVFDIMAVVESISELVGKYRGFFARLLAHNPELLSGGRLKTLLCRAVTSSLKTTLDHDDATLRAVAEFMVSGVLSLYSDWIRNDGTEDLQLLNDVAVKMVSMGLSAFTDAAAHSERNV